jgi:hypothetical protein
MMNIIKSFFFGGFVCALTTYLTSNVSINTSAIIWSFPFTLFISLWFSSSEISVKMLERCSYTSAMTFILLNVMIHSYNKFNNVYISILYGFFVWSIMAVCIY